MKKLIFGLLGALALVGCGGGGNGGGSSDRDARVAFVNAASEGDNLDFYLNYDRRASAVSLGNTPLSFITTDDTGAQSNDVSVTVAGSPTTQLDSRVNPDGTFNADADLLVLAYGLRSQSDPATATEINKRVQLTFRQISRTAPTGQLATIIVFNGLVAANGVERTSIDFRSPGDSTPQFRAENIGYGGFVTLNTAVPTNAGAQPFQVRPAGDVAEYVPTQNLTLQAGHNYLAIVTGVVGGTGTNTPAIRLIDIPTRD